MPSALQQLQEMTVIVADTGDAAEIAKHKPVDCTTNPSLVLGALDSPATGDLIATEVATAKAKAFDAAALCDTLTVAIGANLASLVPGRVSTEVDARLSFDVDASVRRAHGIITDYDRRGVAKDRVLIKLASTWEGIKAAEQLERDGINCNLTLLFSLEQAKACADAGVFLISPFVGRITDWFKKAHGIEHYAPDEDPGVQSVREIYHHYKAHGIKTVVMGASFRSAEQVKALAGCDRLTISPKLLSELGADDGDLPRTLFEDTTVPTKAEALQEADFRWGLNGNAMATEKLAEGIRNFDKDHQKLLKILTDKLS
ncbi:transaldolase [Pseudorhodobacter wandonensis]|uniref:transaldolase n=1 Tax=Pseudorhodobacter wandonensis TaxID=1120568 RepID=UPI00067E171E|nr:transaldolase [Pseudorhodobacter wandonensis]